MCRGRRTRILLHLHCRPSKINGFDPSFLRVPILPQHLCAVGSVGGAEHFINYPPFFSLFSLLPFLLLSLPLPRIHARTRGRGSQRRGGPIPSFPLSLPFVFFLSQLFLPLFFPLSLPPLPLLPFPPLGGGGGEGRRGDFSRRTTTTMTRRRRRRWPSRRKLRVYFAVKFTVSIYKRRIHCILRRKPRVVADPLLPCLRLYHSMAACASDDVSAPLRCSTRVTSGCMSASFSRSCITPSLAMVPLSPSPLPCAANHSPARCRNFTMLSPVLGLPFPHGRVERESFVLEMCQPLFFKCSTQRGGGVLRTEEERGGYR